MSDTRVLTCWGRWWRWIRPRPRRRRRRVGPWPLRRPSLGQGIRGRPFLRPARRELRTVNLGQGGPAPGPARAPASGVRSLWEQPSSADQRGSTGTGSHVEIIVAYEALGGGFHGEARGCGPRAAMSAPCGDSLHQRTSGGALAAACRPKSLTRPVGKALGVGFSGEAGGCVETSPG
jgi:hypothetical protein